MKNWSILNDGVSITATGSSLATQIATTDVEIIAEDLMIDNCAGSVDVFARAGVAGVVATLLSMRVPAGSMQPLRKGPGATHLALITAGASQAVTVFVGDGQ